MEYNIERQKAYYDSGITHPIAFRLAHLRSLNAAIDKHESALIEALHADLGKLPIEAYTTEIGYVLRDIDHACRHLPKWVKARRVHVPLIVQPGKARVVAEPLGVVLILGPWNYPFQLLFSPLIAALAAGNCAIVKPSEHTPHTAAATAAVCADAFPEDRVAVIRGDSTVAGRLVELPFNHIFFTGSTAVGRKVAEAAARKLVPVTLELGGKSPCVVCADAPLGKTARRIMWGKTLNAGQTCVAPDYLLVDERIRDELLKELKAVAEKFTAGDDGARIVNRHHFRRLENLMTTCQIYSGGETDEENLSIKPAILTGVNWDSLVMREEIFGPLLPMLLFTDFKHAISEINKRPAPLSAYLFTGDKGRIGYFQGNVRAGSICINDTLSQILPPEMPFGGVGASGHGRYHGKAGFDAFSNLKSVMTRSIKVDPAHRYPPYNLTLKRLKKSYRWLMK